METPALAAPGRIGPMRLKNRIIMGPMGTNFGTTDGLSTDRDKRYYAERARGGMAMIVTEAMNISPSARNHNNSLCIYHDQFIPGLAAIVESIHAHDTYVTAQLNHRGQLLKRSVLGMIPVGPMDGQHPFTKEPVHGLTIPEIHEIQSLFVEAARRVERAHYDACEIHAANGYLFQQFFTTRFNRRTDEYGGSFANRSRLLLETISKIQDAVPDLPLLVRLSVSEFLPGGYSTEEVIALAQALERLGVVAIDLSGGSNEDPGASRYCIQPPSVPRRVLQPYSRQFKEQLTIPVITAGRIIDPEDAEIYLASGATDFVSVARAALADPHWASKALGIVHAPVRKCISCNVCFERLTLEKDVACVANPFAGTEFETLENLEPQLYTKRAAIARNRRRRVLVIGGGMAGCEAARMASALGATTELWEQHDTLGGQVDLAIAAPDKEDVQGIWDYQMASLQASSIVVRTGHPATLAAIAAYRPDHLFVATGAHPRALPGLQAGEHPPVLQAWDILRRHVAAAQCERAVIIGGGMVGLETADFLLAQGVVCRALVEMRGAIASDMARNNRYEVLERVRAAGTEIHVNCRIQGTTGESVTLQPTQQGDAPRVLQPIGALIVAVGSQADAGGAALARQSGIPFTLIGDSDQPGNFLTAIRSAAMAVRSVLSC